MTSITRHPLHISVLDSFAELRAHPDEQQASFTATISRILSDAFLASDLGLMLPAFLTDEGVSILRMALDDIEVDTVPGAKRPIGEMIGAWHEAKADPETSQAAITSGRFTLCDAFGTLEDLMAHPTLAQGGVLGFFDPIYEDSLVLIQIDEQARGHWSRKISDRSRSQAA